MDAGRSDNKITEYEPWLLGFMRNKRKVEPKNVLDTVCCICCGSNLHEIFGLNFFQPDLKVAFVVFNLLIAYTCSPQLEIKVDALTNMNAIKCLNKEIRD